MKNAHLREKIATIKANLKKTEKRLQYKAENGQQKGVANLISKRDRYSAEQRELVDKLTNLMGLEEEDDG